MLDKHRLLDSDSVHECGDWEHRRCETEPTTKRGTDGNERHGGSEVEGVANVLVGAGVDENLVVVDREVVPVEAAKVATSAGAEQGRGSEESQPDQERGASGPYRRRSGCDPAAQGRAVDRRGEMPQRKAVQIEFVFEYLSDDTRLCSDKVIFRGDVQHALHAF